MKLEILGLSGIGEVCEGDDLTQIILDASTGSCDSRPALQSGDVLVVTQKIVSKAEGQLVAVDPNDPESHRPIAEAQAVRILRRRGQLIITETKHGFICANSGVDRSNVQDGTVALLPEDSDRSARRIRDQIKARRGLDIGVIISDTFGRPWRRGVTDVAIGCAGIAAVVDLRGTEDALGHELMVTEVAIVDEIAAAADLVMGKASGIPVAIVRGINQQWLRRSSVAEEIIRNPSEDLFR